jgi:hypothetical protein
MLGREDGNSNHYAGRDANGERCHCPIVRWLLFDCADVARENVVATTDR